MGREPHCTGNGSKFGQLSVSIMSICQWTRPSFRLRATCIECIYMALGTWLLEVSNIVLKSSRSTPRKPHHAILYSYFWKYNPFRCVCDMKFYTILFLFILPLFFCRWWGRLSWYERYLWLKCISLEMAPDNTGTSEKKGWSMNDSGLKSLTVRDIIQVAQTA